MFCFMYIEECFEIVSKYNIERNGFNFRIAYLKSKRVFLNLINSVFFWLEQLQQKIKVPLRPNLKMSQQNMFCMFCVFCFKARYSSFMDNKYSSSGNSTLYYSNTITFLSYIYIYIKGYIYIYIYTGHEKCWTCVERDEIKVQPNIFENKRIC